MQVPVDAAMAHVVVHIHLMDKLVLIFRIFISYLGYLFDIKDGRAKHVIRKVLQLHDSHKNAFITSIWRTQERLAPPPLPPPVNADCFDKIRNYRARSFRVLASLLCQLMAATITLAFVNNNNVNQ